ncbi:MAG: hypothetical protein WC951_11700 [Bacteroidales bacterium]
MKSTKLISTIFFLSLVFNISCQKQSLLQDETPEILEKISDNPLNIVGVKHNEIVYANMNTYKQGKMSYFIDKFAAELHKDKDMPAYTTSKSNDISKLGELAEKYGDFNYSKSIDMLICDSIVNPKQRQYYDSIVNELDYGSYESFVARIISVNNQVMNDKSLSENEKEAVLSFTSVIYSSYNLWKEYKDTSKAKWWEIAIADAIGAAVGAGVGGGVIGGVVLGAAASLEMSQH